MKPMRRHEYKIHCTQTVILKRPRTKSLGDVPGLLNRASQSRLLLLMIFLDYHEVHCYWA